MKLPKSLGRLQPVIDMLKQTFQEFSQDKAGNMAAGQAYFIVFSLPPLVLLLGLILGFFIENTVIQEQIKHQAGFIGGSAAVNMVQLIFDNVKQQERHGLIPALVSIGALLMGATGIFTQLQDNLNTIWGVEIKPEVGLRHMVFNRVLGFGLILAMGFLVVVSMVSDIGLALVQNFIAERLGLTQYVIIFKLASFVISFALLSLVFGLIFSFLPDVKIKLRDVIAGALFTSALFTISRFALSLYLTHVDVGSSYGAAGSVMVFLFFIYISMQLFFLGAEFTEVYTRTRGDGFVLDADARWLPGRPRQNEVALDTADPKAPAIETETAKREKIGLELKVAHRRKTARDQRKRKAG